MARLANTVPPGNWYLDFRMSREEWEAPLKALQDASDKVDMTKTLEGVCVRFQIADGYANYRVTKNSPLTLELIPFMDGYQIPPAHMRGLDRRDILQLVTAERKMVEMFRKKP